MMKDSKLMDLKKKRKGSLWKQIFKNEIRIKTYRFRKNRGLNLVGIYVLALYWALYIGPNLFDIIVSEFATELAAEYKSIFILFIEYFLTIIFLLVLIYPLYSLYRKTEIEQKEILLSSPAMPGDIFLGEFLGKLFFYFLGILAIGPIITSILMQIRTLNFINYFVIYSSVFVLLAFGLLIGTIIAHLIEYRMAKSQNAREKGNILLFLVSILIIILFYVIRLGFAYIFAHPSLKIWLIYYPSFWYSNIIVYMIDPALTNSHILFIVMNICLGILIPLVVFFLSYKFANHFYALRSNAKEVTIVRSEEQGFYKLIRKLTTYKWKGLVIIQFKQFLRKKENIIKIFYSAVLISISGVLIIVYSNNPTLIRFYISNLKLLIMMIIAWLGGMIFGVLMSINIFIDSKSLLFQYKSSPRGVKALIYSYLYEMLYLTIFLDIVLTIFFTFLFQLNFLLSIIFFILFLANSEIIHLQAVGLQSFKPLFKEQSKNAYLISYSIIGLQIFSFVISFYTIVPNIPNSIVYSQAFLYLLLSHLVLTLGISFLIFYFGMRKLNKSE